MVLHLAVCRLLAASPPLDAPHKGRCGVQNLGNGVMDDGGCVPSLICTFEDEFDFQVFSTNMLFTPSAKWKHLQTLCVLLLRWKWAYFSN